MRLAVANELCKYYNVHVVLQVLSIEDLLAVPGMES
jgi:hypothetical protein